MNEHKRKLTSENEKLISDYAKHLDQVAGLAKGTIYNRTYNARTFLAIQERGGRKDITRLSPQDVQDYIFKIASRYERMTLGNVRATIKSLFKYLHLMGKVNESLVNSIPAMPKWNLSEIPDHMTEEQTEKLLKSFNRKYPIGKRNYALAMILTHLGLRSCEVAAIEIGDIDWETGVLKIRNLKCRRADCLPLPQQVGEAIVDYLKNGRPKSGSRQIFLCHRGKTRPINPRTIQSSMNYRFKKQNMKLASYGTQIIRRTVAGRMIEKGASLKEIADVLRHRHLDTTKIYTKINISLLQQVAMPWPWGAL